MNSLFIFSSIEIVESLQINYLAEVTPRKDGASSDHLHKLPRLLPITVSSSSALRGAFECGLFYIVLRRETWTC
ncbi:hypothetical protein, partial [Parasutterella excrementihominis]|uniref:hypothetical protein n=1 Tax=Parasutterella excrementihominis TaxID=487175 RepID=UPI003AB478CA